MAGSRWYELGTVIRLQIELDRIKENASSRYRDELIRPVERLLVTPAGVLAPLGEAFVVDVHHATHPHSRSNGTNHLSIGFTGHYEAMQARFGAHLTVGIGGESVVVERAGRMSLADLGTELLFELSGGGTLAVAHPAVMHPCAPFTRFCLREDEPPAARLKEGLQFLDDGMRGFKVMPAGGGELVAGARLHARL
ncbi:hypothetical protein EPN42_15180 [bacterium]|nr:MAG: hypothetical protein EPN42_15180 [bacterium]